MIALYTTLSRPMQRLLVGFAVATAACQHTHTLPPDASTTLRSAGATPAMLGELVYEGTVARRTNAEPVLFRYERRVLDVADGLRSSHLTVSPSGEPVVMQRAAHSESYELVEFHEIHAQTGLVGHMEVGDDGTATYHTILDGRTRTRVEAPGDPLQVGPTLFGFALENWDSLLAGNPHAFRFVVLESRRSYRFELRMTDNTTDTTTIAVVPTDPLVALGVPATELVFDNDRNIVIYRGLVPPLQRVHRRLKRLDATVTYEHASEEYR